MTEIKVLDKSVFNRIAAGEVVDKPASIVKELVENSIDAGADNISISVKNGGIDYICVSDNGKGIKPNEIKTAFLPHATSKIRNVEDLDGISTLGFRGEALPSIASVAKVTMTTRTVGSETGYTYVIDNGNEIDFGEMGAKLGTTVTVENLFERIPARRKFLSRDNIEENAISGLVARYILANNNISFKLTTNDRLIYNSTGEGIESAIKSVYGLEYLTNMIKIHNTMSDITLNGYINKPAFSKHSKSFQTLVINGRYVINDEISYTIFGCYQKYLMKRQYPTYVLYLNLPYDLVDVNVHPNKMEVKFAMPSLIKKLVADTVKQQVLEAVNIPKELNFFDVKPSDETDSEINVKTFTKQDFQNIITESPKTNFQSQNKTIKNSVDYDVFDTKTEPQNNQNEKITSRILGPLPSLKNMQPPESLKITDKFKESPEQSIFDALQKEQLSFEIPATKKIVGKLFNTYIIIEDGDSFVLIDQHAAHEKLLYDKYLAEYNNGKVAVQTMLLPYKFNVTEQESTIITENFDILNRTGFEIVQNSPNSFSVKAVPSCCRGLNIKNFIGDFIKSTTSDTNIILPESFREKLMQAACKAATKGEDDLSESEIDSLLKQMASQMKELFCPHGRPVAIKIHRQEIEKWFKRIV